MSNPQIIRLMRAICGLDVHKDSVFLCILHDSGEIFEKVFGVLTHELRDMRRLMQSHGVTEVTMERTAVYWIPIWRVLEPYFHLKQVNPYFIKQLPGRKNDVKPRNDESNKKIKSRRITHGNIFLRKTIIEGAWGASRTKDCFFSRFSYHQTQVRKKNKMKVLVTVARKLLIAVWHVLHDETDYKDFGADNDCDTSVANNG